MDNLSANHESGSSEVEVVKERLKTELAEKEAEVQRLLESVQVMLLPTAQASLSVGNLGRLFLFRWLRKQGRSCRRD